MTLSPSSDLATFGDTVYAANFAKNATDPGYDGIYADGFDTGGWWWGRNFAKWLGFYWGFGRSYTWPAARLGSAAAAGSMQSLRLAGGVTGVYTVPNAAPYAGLGSFYFDLRVHNWSYPAGCSYLVEMPGDTSSHFGVRLCAPASSSFALQVFDPADNAGGNSIQMNPPGIAVNTVTATNPMVLTLAAAPFATTMKAGGTITIQNAGGLGCSGMNGNQTVTAVSGNNLTISFDGSNCVYTAGSGVALSQDFVFRFHRDLTANQIIGEVWNVDGAGYARQAWTIATAGSIALPQTVQIGDADLSVSLAYFRWYSGTIPVASDPPSGVGGDLGDWEFEGNGNDGSGNGLAITFPGSGTYMATPTYAPVCGTGAPRSFRAGSPATLDGTHSFPLDGGTSLAYLWQQVASDQPGTSTQNLAWSTHRAAQPVIAGLAFGPANFQLTVTQGDGQTAVCSVHHGVVATDNAGNVALPDPSVAKMLGPVTRWSADARWPWVDSIEQQWADHIGGLQGKVTPGGAVANFVDNWNVAQAGTVNTANQGTTITGSGTAFKALFCGGGSMPQGPSYIVVWHPYTIAGGGGGTGRRLYQVSSCNSDTSMTITNPWQGASGIGMKYAMLTDADYRSWTDGSASVNYYDSVLAFYAMYFRTGMDSYLGYARWLADAWWTSPYIDRGNATDGQPGWGSLSPRLYSMIGLYLRAIDQDSTAGSVGSSTMWPGLRNMTDLSFRYMMGNGVIQDLRETAYNDLVVALCAAYDPDATHAAACRSDLNSNVLSMWRPQRQPDGHWQSVASQYSSAQFGNGANQRPGTVTASQGSSLVTISGGTWDPAWFGDPGGSAEFFSAYNPTDYTTRDSVTYGATYIDATHIRLNQNYADDCTAGGNSCSGRQWMLASNGRGTAWIGFGTQPSMMGSAGDFFAQAYYGLLADPNHSYDSTAALAKSYAADCAHWVTSAGYDSATRGAYYGVGFGQCKPGTDANGCRCGPNNANCAGTQASRENMGESLGMLAQAYEYSPSDGLLGAIDNLFSADYARTSADPGYDGTYAQDLEPLSGAFWAANNPVWNGFFWGTGRNHGWLSARQGGLAPAQPMTVLVGGKISSVPNAAKMSVTVTEPTGVVDAPVMCAASPCAVTINSAIGNWTFRVAYYSASSEKLSSGTPLVVTVN